MNHTTHPPRHGTLAALCALAILACACKRKHEEASAKTAAERPLHVQTTKVVVRQVPRLIPLTGTLAADLRTELTANASGRVSKTFVERGQDVAEGDLIAQLDVRSARASAAEARASVASARTQLDAARSECERYDALVKRGAITQQDHERQSANCKQQLAAVAVSEARVSSASLVVGDGTIRAPFAGVVTERLVSAGDYVSPSSKVATLVVGNPLRLELTIPERRLTEIKAGQLVSFSPAALATRTFSGTIKYISPEVRATTRDVVVEAVVPNIDGTLRPGMFVDAMLHAGELPMPVVPRSAVFATGEESSLYVVSEHQLVLRIVRLGVEAGDSVAVEDGVRDAELVVTQPTPSMFDGAPVL